MIGGTVAWQALLAVATATFTAPAFRLFSQIASGWILCPGRRTITGMIPTADPERVHAHDAFHRLFRDAVWSTSHLWRSQTVPLVASLCPLGTHLLVLVDDTLAHKTGRKVEGAGVFRDPIRSTVKKIVYALGLNLVVVCLCVRVPGVRQPIALPVHCALFRKGGPSHVQLAAAMVRELAEWLPDRRFRLVGDGAYASLAKLDLPRTVVTSRLRRDAALYDLPAPRAPGQRGRPRKKGVRLPVPPEIAAQAAPSEWKAVDVRCRDHIVHRLVLSRRVLWYDVTGERPLLLVIVRDPEGHERDDYFLTTNPDADPAAVASEYFDRWPIEVTFRDAKQFLAPHQPQSWRRAGPRRAVTVGFWLHTAVWRWYLANCASKPAWPDRPWYTRKCSSSFADALAALRSSLWRARLSPLSAANPDQAKIIDTIVDALARAG